MTILESELTIDRFQSQLVAASVRILTRLLLQP
jgi:hypothetical protein